MANDAGPDGPASPAAASPTQVAGDPDLTRAIAGFVEGRRAQRTRVEYRAAIADFLKKAGVETMAQLLAVTPQAIIRYRNRLQARGLSPSTVNLRLAAVRGLFKELLREGRIPGNPADPELVEGLRVSDESRTEGLSLDEVKAILATCDGTLGGLRDRALLMTLFYEGLRRSEASKLRYRDVTTKRGLVEIRNAKNSPYATIRLRPEVARAIADYLEVLSREMRQRDTRPEDPVFVSLSRLRSFGRALAPSSINNLVKRRAAQAGIKRRVTAHSWRHTCTTLALEGGVPLHQVQRHLRHKDIRTTLRYDRARDVRKNPTLEGLPRIPTE